MNRMWLGLGFVVLGLVMALVGRFTPGFDLHPVTTGLIAIGLVMTGVSLVERRLDHDDDDARPAARDHARTPRR